MPVISWHLTPPQPPPPGPVTYTTAPSYELHQRREQCPETRRHKQPYLTPALSRDLEWEGELNGKLWSPSTPPVLGVTHPGKSTFRFLHSILIFFIYAYINISFFYLKNKPYFVKSAPLFPEFAWNGASRPLSCCFTTLTDQHWSWAVSVTHWELLL